MDSIADGAFNGQHSVYNGYSSYTHYNEVLTQIVIPKSVTYIGRQAFYKCSKLKQVIFAENSQCIEIMGSAFSGCALEGNLILPNSIMTIGSDAFTGSSLAKLSIPESFMGTIQSFAVADTIIWNPTNFSSDYYHYEQRSGYITNVSYGLSYCSSSNTTIKSVILGEDVSHIPAYLCYGLVGLTEIVIPDNVTTMGERAFSGCTSVKKITIGAGITEVSLGVFNGCAASVYIKATTPPNIGSYCFYNATAIYVPQESVSVYRMAWSEYVTKIRGYNFE